MQMNTNSSAELKVVFPPQDSRQFISTPYCLIYNVNKPITMRTPRNFVGVPNHALCIPSILSEYWPSPSLRMAGSAFQVMYHR